MSIERCVRCGRCVDTDRDVEGTYIERDYVCQYCADEESAEAQEHTNHMRQVAREGTR